MGEVYKVYGEGSLRLSEVGGGSATGSYRLRLYNDATREDVLSPTPTSDKLTAKTARSLRSTG